VVNVEQHYDSCVIDVCLTDDGVNRTALCQAIETYVSECQQAGVAIPVWRTEDFCGK